jgi:peptide-methionine (S)-S-oxide reductase
MTGHAETLEITFDPDIISYEKLLEHFWQMHNPTERSWRLPVGSQYRAEIFCESDDHLERARRSKAQLEKSLGQKVTTEITPLTKFWHAEDYHQKYYAKRQAGACRLPDR